MGVALFFLIPVRTNVTRYRLLFNCTSLYLASKKNEPFVQKIDLVELEHAYCIIYA